MSETTTAVKTATEKAATKTASTVAAAAPTIIETAEVALEIPSKVVVNNRLIVTVGVLVGTAAGVGGTLLFNKWNNKRKVDKLVAEAHDTSDAKAGK